MCLGLVLYQIAWIITSGTILGYTFVQLFLYRKFLYTTEAVLLFWIQNGLTLESELLLRPVYVCMEIKVVDPVVLQLVCYVRKKKLRCGSKTKIQGGCWR